MSVKESTACSAPPAPILGADGPIHAMVLFHDAAPGLFYGLDDAVRGHPVDPDLHVDQGLGTIARPPVKTHQSTRNEALQASTPQLAFMTRRNLENSQSVGLKHAHEFVDVDQGQRNRQVLQNDIAVY